MNCFLYILPFIPYLISYRVLCPRSAGSSVPRGIRSELISRNHTAANQLSVHVIWFWLWFLICPLFIPGPSLHAFTIFYLHFCKILLPPQCCNQSSYFSKADRTSPNSAYMSEMTPPKRLFPSSPSSFASFHVSVYAHDPATPDSTSISVWFCLSGMFFFLFSVWC